MVKKISPKSRKRLSDHANPIKKNKPELTDLVSIEDGVIYIAYRVKKPDDSFEKTVEKVRKRIEYAIEKGKIACKGKKVLFGDLLKWVLSKKTWIDEFKEFHTTKGNIVAPSPSVSGSGSTQPSTFEECLKINRTLQREIAGAQQENTKLKEEIERLRPFEQIHEKRKEDGRLSGRKARGRKKNY